MLNGSKTFFDQVFLMGTKRRSLLGRGREGGKCIFVLHKPDSQLVSTTTQALIWEQELSSRNKHRAITARWSPTCHQQSGWSPVGSHWSWPYLLVLVTRELLTTCCWIPDYRLKWFMFVPLQSPNFNQEMGMPTINLSALWKLSPMMVIKFYGDIKH